MRGRAGAAIVVVGLFASCPVELDAPPPFQVTPTISTWGCTSYDARDVCEVGNAATVQLAVAVGTATVAVDARRIGSIVGDERHGELLVLTASVTRSGSLTLRVGAERVSIELIRLPKDGARAQLDHLLAIHANDAAEVLAERFLREGTATDRIAALSAKGRVVLRRTDGDGARRLFEQAVALGLAEGRRADAAMDLGRRIYVDTALRADPRGALETLDQVAELRAAHPLPVEVEAYLELFDAMMTYETGGQQAALSRFQRLKAMTRFVSPRVFEAAWQLEANHFLAHGQFAVAEALLEDAQVTACGRQSLWLVARWTKAELGLLSAAELREAFARGAAVDEQLCADPGLASTNAVNLSLLALFAGDPASARRWLMKAREGGALDVDYLRPWVNEAEARVATFEGDVVTALARYRESVARAQLHRDDDDEWIAQTGLARALWQIGRRAEAIQAGARAHALAERLLLRAVFGESKATYPVLVTHADDEQVERLIAERRLREAAQLARDLQARSIRQLVNSAAAAQTDPARRARVMAFIEARDRYGKARERDWEKSTETLQDEAPSRARERVELDALLESALEGSPLVTRCAIVAAPDEVTLIAHEMRHARWILAVRGDEVAVRELAPGASLDDLTAMLEPAARIRVLEASSSALDVGSALWKGEPLWFQRPISYGLDVCATGAAVTAAHHALVVENPRGDLLHAASETAAIRATKVEVELLARQQARLEPIAQGLASGRFGLFHFSGHAEYQGNGGWGAALLLADGEKFRVPDALALARTPARVVLSACELGRGSAAATLRGLGIGQAFVAAGATEVLVTTTPVADEITAELIRAMYERLGSGESLPMGLFGARRAMAQARPEVAAALGAYRVLVP